jgi:hypothetical protein
VRTHKWWRRNSEYAAGSTPHAHIWPTLRPKAAGRLALPGCGPRRNVAPEFAARFFRKATAKNKIPKARTNSHSKRQ